MVALILGLKCSKMAKGKIAYTAYKRLVRNTYTEYRKATDEQGGRTGVLQTQRTGHFNLTGNGGLGSYIYNES